MTVMMPHMCEALHDSKFIMSSPLLSLSHPWEVGRTKLFSLSLVMTKHGSLMAELELRIQCSLPLSSALSSLFQFLFTFS